MTPLRIASVALFLLTSASAIAQSTPSKSETVSARARQIHNSAIVVDTHADTPQRFLDGNFDIGSTDPKDLGHVSVDKARAGNLGAEFFSIWVEPSFKGQYAHRAMDLIDSVYQQAGRHPDRMMMAFSVGDIERAHKQKKLASLMGIEGGHAIENDLRLLRDFYKLGVRYMTLTWSNTNEWADSSGDISNPKIEHHNGLTDLGKQVVQEMNRLGMMVDISHVADKTFYDAVATSRAPVIASHSAARALSNVPRNMTDEMIVALAKKGGVVQVNFACEFLSQKSADASKELLPRMTAARAENDRALMEQYRKQVTPAMHGDVVAHIDHIVKIAGINAVGIGSDFDGILCAPKDLEDVSKFPNLTRALLEKGYSPDDIRKIYGGNFLRVMRAA